MFSFFRNAYVFSEIDITQNSCFIRKGLNTNIFGAQSRNGLQDTLLFRQNVKRCFKSQQRKVSKPADVGLEGSHIESTHISYRSLVKPFGFTIAFSSASIAGAAIWQYETMRSHAIEMMKKPNSWLTTPKKFGGWRQELYQRWNNLREGERIFIPICLLNVLVFAAWRVPRFQPNMIKYFCSNPAAKILCWPMVLSTFSQYSGFHLLANMYVLHSFSSGVVSSMGKEQFLAMYLCGGVVSSFTSYLYKAVTAQSGLSLGASGAIMAVLGYVCSEYPETQLSIIFLPMYTFSAGLAIKVIMGVDMAGLIMGWKFFDHAAHLGGAFFGLAWCYYGNAYIWQKREPLLQFWHKLRGNTVR